MFNTRSDFALNKVDQAAIVCQSVTGEYTRLTREDFSSEDEFAHWKKWSDDNYHKIELAGRNDDDCRSFEGQRDALVPSAEDVVLGRYIAAEQAEARHQTAERIKTILTSKQYRRMYLRHICNLSIEEIADKEGVTPQAIYGCLAKAEKAIINNL